MKIALVACPAWANWAPNPALLLLAAQLRRAGHVVDLFDLNIDCYRDFPEKYKSWWLDENSTKWETSTYVDEMWNDTKDIFSKYSDKIISLNPGLIGFSINAGARLTSPLLASLIRSRTKNIPIVVGGADCFRSEYFTKHMIAGVTDALCTGEGDTAIIDLANIVESIGYIPTDMPGFVTWENRELRTGKFLDNGDSTRPANLDELAPVTLDGVDLNHYTLNHRVTMSISRGCTKRCTFCSEGTNFHRYRTHSAEWMIKQLRTILPEIRQVCGSKPHINFNDSLINGDMSVLEALCDGIIAEGLDFAWGGMAIVRPEMTLEFLKKMKRAGCIEICWGIESGSTRILELMAKGLTVSMIDQVNRLTEAVGITQYGNIIIGFPGETPREFAETILFAAKNIKFFNCLGLPIYTPVKNSTVYKMPHKFGMASLDTRNWTTEDNKNTPEIRVFRRKILEFIVAERRFDQGRFDELISSHQCDYLNKTLQNEFIQIYNCLIDLLFEYLQVCYASGEIITFTIPEPIELDTDLGSTAIQRILYNQFLELIDNLCNQLGEKRSTLPLLPDRVDISKLRKPYKTGSLPIINSSKETIAVPQSKSNGQWITVGGGK